jgi:hypothetical protein
MSIFSRLLGGLPGSVDDPVLGQLTRADQCWSGTGHWAELPQPFALTIHRDAEIPQDSDRAAYQAQVQGYAARRPDIQHALFTLWEKARPGLGDDAPDFGSALHLWQQLQLQGLGLHPDGHAELIYGFTTGSPEGAFLVSVQNADVAPLEYVE